MKLNSDNQDQCFLVARYAYDALEPCIDGSGAKIIKRSLYHTLTVITILVHQSLD